MKRPLAMLLCLVLMLSLYAACSMNGEKTADAAPSITFTRDNMPRLDGLDLHRAAGACRVRGGPR